MTLTSLVYLGFFAAVAVLHYVLPRVLRPYFLLVANYAFYCYAPQYRPLALVLAGATLITWLCGLVIGSTRVKAVRVLFLLLTLLGAPVFCCITNTGGLWPTLWGARRCQGMIFLRRWG